MIKIELKISFVNIEQVKRTRKKSLIIDFKNGDKITIYGEQAQSVYKKLCRNKAGEHLD